METISTINDRLLNLFGKFENVPIWRVVYSEDQFEKRLSWYTDEGFKLLTPRVVELPKYKQWIHNKYILERAMPVPSANQSELTEKLSYEPVWTFEDSRGNPLPPVWEAIEVIIHTVHQASAMAVGQKYKDPDDDNPIEERELRLERIHNELFGNETEVGDALAHKQAIVVPRNYNH